MQDNKNIYEWLFPYEKIPMGSKIIIYGADEVGQHYLRQLMLTNYCSVIAMADRNYESYTDFILTVCNPLDIHTYNFDYIVIALQSEIHLGEIRRILYEQNIENDKIIYQSRRIPTIEELQISSDEKDLNKKRAYQIATQSLSLSVNGGFGDYIIQKRAIETIIQLAPSITIDIYALQGVEFLEFLYQGMSQINFIGLNRGISYDKHKNQYSLAIKLRGSTRIYVDELKQGCLPRELETSIASFRESSKDRLDSSIPVHSIMYSSLYRGHNCYDRIHMDGLLPRDGDQIEIPFYKTEYKRLLKYKLGNYITVNFGNGDNKDSSQIAKSWHKERFEQLISMIRAEFPLLRIVHIGATGTDSLNGVDYSFLGENWRFVSQVLRHSQLHIDIEGGLVHLATQLGTKCAVLFGPTPVEYYGYKQNINIRAGNCHNCYGLYSDVNKCARGMAEPECMYSITAEYVMSQINDTLKQIDIN